MTKRSAASRPASDKRPKKAKAANPNVNKTVDSLGFCTHPDRALSPHEQALVTGEEDDDGCAVLSEKELVGKGTKKLHWLSEGKGKLVFYFHTKKCVKTDRLRIQGMVDAARKAGKDRDGSQAYVLLASEAGICKRNTLPELVAAGYVVQRVD